MMRRQYKSREEHLLQIRKNHIYAILGVEQSLGRTNIDVAKQLLENEIKVLQYRDKNKNMKEKYQECCLLRELTYQYNATFIVNDSLELALAVDADGIHVGQKDLPIEVLANMLPSHMIIGLSINTLEQLESELKRKIADYIGIGPFYQTSTKLDASSILSETVKNRAKECENLLPCVPIGGITREVLKNLRAEGFQRFAMISELVGAVDIGQRIKEINEIWTK